MQISNDTKLDFEDILLVPQRSPNASRSDVNLSRKYTFFHSNREWNGVPIIAANMDTTGTIEMANALQRHNMVTCLHKHYDLEHLIQAFKFPLNLQNAWVSIGMKRGDSKKLFDLCEAICKVPNVCIDIANGYTERFVEYCASIRKKLGTYAIIMAGNVCTPEMTQELILQGCVDFVKIGIGPG